METQVTTRVHCPICANTPAKEILVKYSVTAKADGQTEVGGLGVFMCGCGHVFFIRRLDADFTEGPKAAPLAGVESVG